MKIHAVLLLELDPEILLIPLHMRRKKKRIIQVFKLLEQLWPIGKTLRL